MKPEEYWAALTCIFPDIHSVANPLDCSMELANPVQNKLGCICGVCRMPVASRPNQKGDSVGKGAAFILCRKPFLFARDLCGGLQRSLIPKLESVQTEVVINLVLLYHLDDLRKYSCLIESLTSVSD